MTEDDFETFFDQQADPDAAAMAAFPSRDRASFFTHWRKIVTDESVVTRTIDANGEVAGNIVSWTQDGHREIGYWIGKAFWGKGIATDALRQFLHVVNERPLFAWVAHNNVGSIRVLEKCGFTVARDQPDSSEGPPGHIVLELSARSLRD